MIPTIAPIGRNTRVSSDSCWPLRGVDGLTFAERRARSTAASPDNRPRPVCIPSHSPAIEAVGEKEPS